MDNCSDKWFKTTQNGVGTAERGERGEISNRNGVGSQIFVTSHCPRCKLSKTASIFIIEQLEVVENEGELCRKSQKGGKSGKISNSNEGGPKFLQRHTVHVVS